MNFENYRLWVEANLSTPEAMAFYLGLGVGAFVRLLQYCLRLLKKSVSE